MLKERTEVTVFDKNNPFLAKMTVREELSQKGSEKETIHFVVDLAGSGLSYTVGDSMGVYPQNDPGLVDELLSALGFSGSEGVVLPKTEVEITLREAFLHRLSLAQPTKKFLKWLHERVGDAHQKGVLDGLLSEERAIDCKEYLEQREFLDLAVQFDSAEFTAQEYIEQMRKLQPRLYSIASSPEKHPQEVHLTVAVVRYRTNERDRKGVATTYLADRVALGQTQMPVFIAKSHFGLPEELSSDVIMVGPGTGVAPFRAFLQEYDARGGTGRTWLFFGEQRREFDYLYGEEMDEYHERRVLTKLDLAFSRDQDYKVYVQHKMEENAEEIWKWLESGAYFYICGDAKRMAKDVEAVLMDLIMRHGGHDEAGAKEYLKAMKKAKRYQKDVY